MKDEADTDFVCKTSVSVFMLTHPTIKTIKRRRQDLKKAVSDVKIEVLTKADREIALDYIIHNNQVSKESY